MIVVFEGPSAAGKTTWAARWPAASVVAETGPVEVPTMLDVDEIAQAWADLDARRWSTAVATEAATGLAVCDTDPLKLHYSYCLARVDAGDWAVFDAGVRACRRAIAAQRLGIADLVACWIPDDAVLVAQREGDVTRGRRNFARHRRMAGPLRDWYEALAALDPGRVMWQFPDLVDDVPVRDRYDIELFDAWMAALPR
jgi:hypothetical protein